MIKEDNHKMINDGKTFNQWLISESLSRLFFVSTALCVIEILILFLMRYGYIGNNSVSKMASISLLIFAFLTQPILYYWLKNKRPIDGWSYLMVYSYLFVLGYFAIAYGFYSKVDYKALYIYFMVVSALPVIFTINLLPWMGYNACITITSVFIVLKQKNPNVYYGEIVVNLIAFDVIILLMGYAFFKLKKADFIKSHQLMRANTTLKRMAVTDEMTGSYNHTYTFKKLESLITEKKEGDALSLAMFDLDHFKRINDGYGHLAGDDVLIKFAKILHAQSREFDFVTRYGGEEFIMIFQHTDAKSAAAIVEAIQAKVKDESWVADESLTFSCGIVEHEDEDAKTLIQMADAQMYYVKEHGRGHYRIAKR